MYTPYKQYSTPTLSIMEQLSLHHRLDTSYHHRQVKRDILSIASYKFSSGYKASRFLQNIQKDILTYIVLAQSTKCSLPTHRDRIQKQFFDDPVTAYQNRVEPYIDFDSLSPKSIDPLLRNLQQPILSLRYSTNVNHTHHSRKKRYPDFTGKGSFITKGKEKIYITTPEEYFRNNESLCDMYAIAYQQGDAIMPPWLHHRVDNTAGPKHIKDGTYDFCKWLATTNLSNTAQVYSLNSILAHRIPQLYQPTKSKPHSHKNPLFSTMLSYLKRDKEDFDNGQETQLPDPTTERYIPPLITASYMMQQKERNKKDILLSACPLNSYSLRESFMQSHPQEILLTGYASPESYLAVCFGGAWIAGENNRDTIHRMYYTSQSLYYPNDHDGGSYKDISARQINAIPLRFSLEEIVKAVLRSLRPENINPSDYLS